MAMAILQSSLWATADDELRTAVYDATLRGGPPAAPSAEREGLDQLPRLREEIERAWNVRRNIVVHRLAEEHPAVADELYAFFADVIEAEDDMEQGRKHPERAETDRRIREYLEREGYRRAAEVKAARPPVASPEEKP
jgi:hypothetical protein